MAPNPCSRRPAAAVGMAGYPGAVVAGELGTVPVLTGVLGTVAVPTVGYGGGLVEVVRPLEVPAVPLG